MKKLLIVLTVVSMAALLFTGCLPTPNTAPVITYSASQTATTEEEFTSTVTATDADEGDTLTFSVSDGPTGMVIDSATGVISGWTPAVAGTETVLVAVTDGTDTSTLLVTITVSDPVVPVLDITIAVAGEYLETATNKTYVKGGSREITVTFPAAITDIPVIKVGTVEVPVFSTDDKVWLGSHNFTGDSAKLITVSGVCEDICAAKSVVVDSSKPYAKMKAKVETCACETGYDLNITTDWTDTTDCIDCAGCCGDDPSGSGLDTWNIKVFDEDPWKDCCVEDTCVLPIAEESGTICPVAITTECIEAVYTQDDVWVDFFDKDYWVVVTLADKVDNVMTYFGRVEAESTTDVKFIELYFDATSADCTCPAENPALADEIMGDCDGTPTTECWELELNPCPEVTLVPEEPYVGEEVTITIDYSDAVKPTGVVAAYVGPYIKDFSTGIPDDARELVLSGPVDYVYTATYTFGQAGTDYIYVTDDCEDCTACKYAVTVLPVGCPVVTFSDSITFDGMTVIDGGEHLITVVFDEAVAPVRVFISDTSLGADYEQNLEGLPEDSIEVAMTASVDGKTYTGTGNFGSGDCKEIWVYVAYDGDPCCMHICDYQVVVDSVAPKVDLKAVIGDEENCGTFCDPDPGHRLFITSADWYDIPTKCYPLCCYDNCTDLEGWTITVYDTQPFDDCCVSDPCVDPIKVCPGTGCPVTCDVFGCVSNDDWSAKFTTIGTYYVVFEASDSLGNTYIDLGILVVNPALTTTYSATLNDAQLTDIPECQIEEGHLTHTEDDDIMGPCIDPTTL